MSSDRESMVVCRHEDGTLEIVSQGTETQLISRDLLVEVVASLNQNLAEIERLRAERDDHKARLAVEAVTAPDADYDTMVDSLQARIRDMWAEIERLRAAGDEMRANCDAWGVLHGRRMEQIKALRAEVAQLMDGMEWAWSLLANGQYWDRTDGRRYGEWNDARLKWRDEHWHPALERNSEVRYEQ